ncbi:hypothetical protein LTR24_007172 [Lithohypha guttulata]|uniref:Alpha-carbonic anhydrase domain-containing protein n=1 Tax=Lithohypha guttulata TaxID=1690604 RepID=A0ABR0K4S2_9EURO|nr:hypothetical protein LTR24_007172 [Lithohypha guttulata]
MLTFPLLLPFILPLAFGCPQHENHIAPLHNNGQIIVSTSTAHSPPYWSYDTSYDWGRLSPDYTLCQVGTNQSPIALWLNDGLPNRRPPDFTGYRPNATGEYYNWGYGPAFTFYHHEGDYSGLPTIEVDNQTLYMKGWHIHAPSDHVIDGKRSRAELHLVHYDTSGAASAVISIRLGASREGSLFFAQLPSPAVHFNDTSAIQNVVIDPLQIIREVGDFAEFWTYKGSLTTPPCTEGVQWFVARETLLVGVKQMQDILGASTFAARVEQEVWLHDVNM